ncbi:MAG TPA: DUF4124 domain-containing protein, partial [Polyangiaceae bacterium]|nr:DUF4124 domain-containing protein [Polyangiaceae bacterium]
MPELTPIPPLSLPLPNTPDARRWLRPSLAGISSALVLTLASTSQADIYKTVGADGVISFTNSAKKGGQLYERSEPKR